MQQGALDVDGIPLEWQNDRSSSSPPAGDDIDDVDHPNGATSLDHLVISTDSLDRTSAAVAETLGLPLLRVREVGDGPNQVRQGFHRFADRGCIVEVVEPPTLSASASNSGPAVSIFGVVVITARLGELAAELGDELLSPPRAAVQPGRSIATVRSRAGLPIALALMTPEPTRG